MAVDKRTIVAGKRARALRKKALRSNGKQQQQQQQEQLLSADKPDAYAQECDGMLTPTDLSSGDDEALSYVAKVAPLAATIQDAIADALAEETESLDNQQELRAGEQEQECDQYDSDEDELVLVGRPTVPGFCTEFVLSTFVLSTNLPGATSTSTTSKSRNMNKFTVRIPAFRETRDGYTTYSIQVALAGSTQFQLERRYSEFVAFASSLDEYFKSPLYEQLRDEQHRAVDSEDTKSRTEGDVTNLENNGSFRWELPPKTWFRMTQTTALEDRRSKLEWSLQTLLAHDPTVVCQIPLVRDFLMLDICGAQVIEEDEKHQCA